MGSGGFRVLGVGSSKTYYFGYEDYEQDYTGNLTLNPKPYRPTLEVADVKGAAVGLQLAANKVSCMKEKQGTPCRSQPRDLNPKPET